MIRYSYATDEKYYLTIWGKDRGGRVEGRNYLKTNMLNKKMPENDGVQLKSTFRFFLKLAARNKSSW